MSHDHIGCSGYYYPYWKNKFYPQGLQPKDWLKYYSTVFNTVELNGTFYRVPKLSDLQKYASVTSDDFRFSVKMSRLVTHVSKLNNCREKVMEFQDLILQGLGNKLMYFLFQMPPSFQYNEENLARILNAIPHEAHQVVELRHVSWWNDDVKEAFQKAGITFCNVDFPGLDTYFINTTREFYLRLHGSPELFKSSYDTASLKSFYSRFPEACANHTVYFNNTYYEAGYTNALEFIKLTAHA